MASPRKTNHWLRAYHLYTWGVRALVQAMAILAGCDEQVGGVLKQYSDALGIAYQIKDDLAPISTDGFEVAVSEQDAFGGGSALQIVVSGIDGDHAIKDAIAFVKKPFDPEP